MLATDGSPSAEAATEMAIDLAKSLGRSLAVVSVAQSQTPFYAYYGSPEIVAKLEEIQEETISKVFAKVETQAQDAGVPCLTFAAQGIPGEQICRLAGERDAHILVVGAHGWGSVGRLFHGSVSTDVLHHASMPVLVVRSPESGAGNEQ
jgi:nucleotide-binding universal stress UspA family protein